MRLVDATRRANDRACLRVHEREKGKGEGEREIGERGEKERENKFKIEKRR